MSYGLQIMKRVVWAALVVGVVSLVGAHAAADEGKGVTFELTLVDDVDVVDKELPGLKDSKAREMTRMTAGRIEKRLEAAQFKHFEVVAERPRKIKIDVMGGVERDLVGGVVIPPGRLELRPVEAVGDLWLQHLPSLPTDVQMRQKSGSLYSHDAYLWSESRSRLAAALDSVEMDGVDLAPYPDREQGGWKSLALGPPLVTHSDVSDATVRRSKTGRPHVRVNFRRNVAIPDGASRAVDTWAVLVDGEVVTTFKHGDKSFGESVTLPAPAHLSRGEASRKWAQQVAGRLAAYLPVTLMEYDED